jgi:hypothetical protein
VQHSQRKRVELVTGEDDEAAETEGTSATEAAEAVDAEEPADAATTADDPEEPVPVEDVPADELRDRVSEAVDQVRSEARKAAAVHAVVDGAVVLLAVNLVLAVVEVSLPGPGWADIALAGVLGLATGVAEFLLRTRTPLVEQFEAVNPAVREALRTARDAAADGADTRMARRLYADVLDGLRSASSDDLVSRRHVSAGVVLVLVLAVGTVGVTAAGIELGLGGGEDTAPGDGGPASSPGNIYDGLQDGDAVLGEETNVSGGDDEQDVVIGGSAGDAGGAPTTDRSFETGGFASEAAYDAQQAGFDAPDDVENADIIREYNLRIREDEES